MYIYYLYANNLDPVKLECKKALVIDWLIDLCGLDILNNNINRDK